MPVLPVVTQNRLISLMPEKAAEALFKAGNMVNLALGVELLHAGANVTHVYFPLSGYISVLSDGKGASPIELGMAGDEGMFGAATLLGVARSSSTALVQGEGSALRVPAAAFLKTAKRYPQIAKVVYAYLHVVIAQLGQNAACNGSHAVESRLARWLLMTCDRAHGPSFAVTHEFLSMMLGVRRAGVTLAAQRFKKKGIVHYARGKMTILDRSALESAACSCFSVMREEYRTTMTRSAKRVRR